MNKIEIFSPFFELETDGINLTAYFAERGQDRTQQELVALGEKVEDAIYGYALAGNTHQVESLLGSCPALMRKGCIGSAIRGYARAGRMDDVHAFADYRDYMADLLAGLAQAGQTETVTRLLERHIHLFNHAVFGYASCNHQTALMDLIAGTSYFSLAIYHAARSGHMTLVDELLSKCGVNDADINTYSLLNHALQGYLSGRHFALAAGMLVRGANITQAVLDLKDAKGLPAHELYLAFLAHIQDVDLRNAVKEEINLQAELMDAIQITQQDTEQLDRLMQSMEEYQLNYVEACSDIDKDMLVGPGPGQLTLQLLADAFSDEPVSFPLPDAGDKVHRI